MVQTRSQAGKALKAPKRLIEETPITNPVTKKRVSEKIAVKKSVIKKSTVIESRRKKKYPSHKKKAAADQDGKKKPAIIIYEVTDKHGKKRTKYLEIPREEIDQFNCPCDSGKFESKGLKGLLQKKMRGSGVWPRGDFKAQKPQALHKKIRELGSSRPLADAVIQRP